MFRTFRRLIRTRHHRHLPQNQNLLRLPSLAVMLLGQLTRVIGTLSSDSVVFLMNFQRLRIYSLFICKLLFFCCLLSHSTVKITKLNLLPIRQAPMRIIQWKTNFRRTRLELFSLGSFHVNFLFVSYFLFSSSLPVFLFSSLPSGEGV